MLTVNAALLLAGCLSPLQGPAHKPLTAKNALVLLSPGMNLGNTLEAIPNESSWGNPPTSDAYFAALRKAGFRSIRIPAAWSQYSDSSHRIDPKWMSRVQTVVRQAEKAGLYVLLNVHWDGGWLQPTYAKREEATKKLTAFWKQIATSFRSHGESLLFAGTNEVHVEGNYGPPSPENAEVQNGFNQAFVNTVRATGGRNRNRWLVVQGYNTDIDHTLKVNTKLPKDTAKGRLMMEVHYYSPYNFALNEKSSIWQWGARTKDPKAADGWGNEDYVDAQFQKIQKAFVDKGIPVLLGEYGAYVKPQFPEMKPFVLDWVSYVTRSSVRHGMVPMYWDTGTETGLFNRTTGKVQNPDLLKALITSGSLAPR